MEPKQNKVQTIRTFIALALPPEAVEALAALQHALQQAGVKARWVKPAGMHLTLKFLGEMPLAQLDGIKAALAAAAQDFESLALSICNLGVFPNLRNPKVVWAGLNGEVARLQQLSAALENGLEPLGFAKETRGFAPHLTLARNPEKADLLQTALQQVKVMNSGAFVLDKVVFYQSVLKPSGPEYRVLQQYMLKN